MKRKSMTTALLCLAVVVILALVAAPVQAKRNLNPRVIPPQAKPFGLSYGEWGAKWYQWVASTPVAPEVGTGSNSGEGQSGPVWFLGVNQLETLLIEDEENLVGMGEADWTITMPAGKALFFSIFDTINRIPDGGTTEAELRAGNEWWTSHVTELEATVDGRPLRNLFAYRGMSSLVSVEWVAGNLWQYDPAVDAAVTDGYWVMLAPLPVGKHVVHTTRVFVIMPEEIGLYYRYTSEYTYHITVTPR